MKKAFEVFIFELSIVVFAVVIAYTIAGVFV